MTSSIEPSFTISTSNTTYNAAPPARKRPRKSTRKSPRTHKEKVVDALQAIEDSSGLTLLDMLRILAKNKGEPELRRPWGHFTKFAYQEMPKTAKDLPDLEISDLDTVLDEKGFDRICHKLRKELVVLTKDAHCGRFIYAENDQDGYLDQLATLQQTIIMKAPQTVKLLSSLARQSNTSRPLEQGPRQVFWILQFLFSIQRAKCSGFAKTLAIYLHNGGAKKYVIDLMSSLGVCCSYNTTQMVLGGIERGAVDEVPTTR